MNSKKGQMGLGTMITVFIAIVAALALYQGITPLIGTTTGTLTAVNTTITQPADGVSIDLAGQEYISGVIVTNATGGQVVPATNYTIGEAVSTATGVKTVSYTGAISGYAGESVNISYVYGADGYIDSSAGRSLALLIPIFAALAIALAALSSSFRNGLLDMIGK